MAKLSNYPWPVRLSAGQLLAISVIEVALLVFLLLCRAYHWLYVDRLPAVIGGVLPLVVPWAGALGGVSISLVGVSAHMKEWGGKLGDRNAEIDDAALGQRMKWNTWHLTRPLLGSVFGTFAALILVFVLGAIGLTDGGDIDLSPAGAATLMVLAFVVGYRERTFRALVERVVDTVLGPGTDPETAPSYDLTPAALDFGEVAIGSHKDLAVKLSNTGSRMLRIADVSVSGDGFRKVQRVPNVGPGDSEDIQVRFAPRSSGAASGTLLVKAGGKESSVTLKGSAP